jgi:uncharacterized protein (DUF952 family)
VNVRCLLAHDVHGHRAHMRRPAMFPDIDTLPRSKRQSAVLDRQAHVHGGQRRAHVGGHIVHPFDGVGENRVAIRHQPLEEPLEIATHVRIGILLHEERCRRVLQVQCADAGLDPREVDLILHLRRDVVEPAPPGLNDEASHVLSHFASVADPECSGYDGTVPPTLIFKIVPAELWREAEAAGSFAGSPVDVRDGFIHLSTATQVRETAARHFQGQAGLLLVAVSDDLRDLKWEPSRGGELFPHLYANLPLSAARWVKPLTLRSDGRHDFPDLAE